MTDAPPPPAAPAFSEALAAWRRVALLSFGGPAAQIAVMHRILVIEKAWIDERRFLHALNFCMLLPGPEAQQLATYCGWLLHGVRGGLAAGLLFILPGFLAILALSVLYVLHGDLPPVEGLLFGLKSAVLAVVLVALDRLRRKTLRGGVRIGVALGSFVALFFLQLPFPLVILSAALVGALWIRHEPAATGIGLRPARRARPLVTLAAWLVIWLAPLVALALWLGETHVLVRLGTFFSQVAVVSFGGAYAVLAYVAQHAVEAHQWLSPREMLDGLGLAETTPGPLIQVVQFVGFLAAWRAPEPFGPMLAAVLGSVVTTWVTFAPCFLWIFLGAPWVDRLLGRPRLASALAGVGAAVVGALMNLSLWFALHALFGRVDELHTGPVRWLVPDVSTLDWVALAMAAAALVLLTRFRLGLLPTLGLIAAAGALRAVL